MKNSILVVLGSVALLAACGKSPIVTPPAPAVTMDSEGQPVAETREALGPDAAEPLEERVALDEPDLLQEVGAKGGYVLPDFQASWGLSRSVYDRAVTYMDLHGAQFTNQHYVIVIDMSKPSSAKRLFFFDLDRGTLEKHNVAHGSGSDPKATGFARFFSNAENSDKTSLGAYRTTATYSGKHGTQLRLDGLESTNDNALARGIVLHGANYVHDGGRTGRSWGCPAMDPRVSGGIINRMKGGAFLYIGN
jgi:hypothetical protein